MFLKGLSVFIVYVLVTILEIIPLKKENNKKKFILYILLISLSAAISVLIAVGIDIPSPSIPIKQFIAFLFGR